LLQNNQHVPPLFTTIKLAIVANVLDCTPTENGIVSDEGCNVTTGNCVLNLRVNEVGEEGDTAFKVCWKIMLASYATNSYA